MKGKAKYNINNIQVLVMAFIWVLVFAIPILAGDFQMGIEWNHIFRIWLEYGIVFGIFLINHFILLPYLFFKGRRALHFITIGGIIILFVFSMFLARENRMGHPSPEMVRHEVPGPEPGHPPPFPPPKKAPKSPVPPYANLLIFSVLMIGFDTGLVFYSKWLQSEQNKLKLEKENVETKMAFLQNQISPHFFMNTLNNIHALVDINSDEAKNSILKLSKMMGYLLYESQTDKVPIKKEMEFISSYVELMKLRFTDHVQIETDVPEELPLINVPPLLTISFIENAFKHGISYEKPSYVRMKYSFRDDRVFFTLENSVHARNMTEANSGIGLDNSRKRLDLIYGDSYELELKQTSKDFLVLLNIPV